MGWREKANKSLDAEDPAQTLLNSMGVFVRAFFKGDGWSLVSRGGLRQLSFILGGRWKVWRCWQEDQDWAGGTSPPLYLKGLQTSWRPSLAPSKLVAALSLLLLR